jgi:hypothetical protein
MQEPLDRSQSPWLRLRRLLHLEGNLPGLHYSVQIRTLEHVAAEVRPPGREILPADDRKLLTEAPIHNDSTERADARPAGPGS